MCLERAYQGSQSCGFVCLNTKEVSDSAPCCEVEVNNSKHAHEFSSSPRSSYTQRKLDNARLTLLLLLLVINRILNRKREKNEKVLP